MKQVTTRQVSPFQVEFPKTKKVKDKKDPVKFERTKDGALHFRPGTVVILTDDEYDFLQKDMIQSRKFIFQGEVKKPKKAKPPMPTMPKPQEPKKAKKKS